MKNVLWKCLTEGRRPEENSGETGFDGPALGRGLRGGRVKSQGHWSRNQSVIVPVTKLNAPGGGH